MFLQWVTLQTTTRVQVFEWCILLGKGKVVPVLN
jgi:hypothetical protein